MTHQGCPRGEKVSTINYNYSQVIASGKPRGDAGGGVTEWRRRHCLRLQGG